MAKQRMLREYAKRYGLRVFVESGTYFGDMHEAMKADFDRIYSVELSRDLHEKAITRFQGITILNSYMGTAALNLKE